MGGGGEGGGHVVEVYNRADATASALSADDRTITRSGNFFCSSLMASGSSSRYESTWAGLEPLNFCRVLLAVLTSLSWGVTMTT